MFGFRISCYNSPCILAPNAGCLTAHYNSENIRQNVRHHGYGTERYSNFSGQHSSSSSFSKRWFSLCEFAQFELKRYELTAEIVERCQMVPSNAPRSVRNKEL